MKVVWSPLAIERAYDEARYIAGDKPHAALRWPDGLFESADRLKRFPDSGRMVPEIGLPEYREVIYNRSHRLIYRREEKQVSILTVRRLRRQLDTPEVLDQR